MVGDLWNTGLLIGLLVMDYIVFSMGKWITFAVDL